MDGLVSPNLKDQGRRGGHGLFADRILKSLRCDSKHDIRVECLVVCESKRKRVGILSIFTSGDVDLVNDVLEECRRDDVAVLFTDVQSHLSDRVVKLSFASLRGKLEVFSLACVVTDERDCVVVSPSEVIAKLFSSDLHLLHVLPDVREVALKHTVEVRRDSLHWFFGQSGESFAVLCRGRQKEILLESTLLDWESLETIWQSGRAKLLLPLGEVSTLDRGDSILLLPFSEIVCLSAGVQSHHLSLEGQNVLGHKRSLEVQLRNFIISVQQLGFVDIATAELGADEELLTLADWRDSVSVLGLLAWVDGQVEASLRAGKRGRIHSDQER